MALHVYLFHAAPQRHRVRADGFGTGDPSPTILLSTFTATDRRQPNPRRVIPSCSLSTERRNWSTFAVPKVIWSIGKSFEVGPRRYAPYVLAPQGLSTDRSWDNPEILGILDDEIQSLIDRGIVDGRRVYLTGHSLGGMGTWYLPVHFHRNGFTTRFAALAPMAGFWHDNSEVPYRGVEEAARDVYVDTPIWAFHHTADGPQRTSDIVERLENEGLTFQRNDAPRLSDRRYLYTEYSIDTLPCTSIACHRVCDTAVHDRYFLEWLFEQRRTL